MMVIQRTLWSTLDETEAMHGFTLLFPRGWSMYLLHSIAYTGTLVGGLAERRTQYREAGLPCFPEHFSAVCRAGQEWEQMKGNEEKERWARKPPGKRAEWSALGTTNPFIPDWVELMTVSEGEMRCFCAEPIRSVMISG